MNIKNLLLGIIIAAVGLSVFYLYRPSDATTANNYSDDVVQRWIELGLTLSQETPGYTPPVAARAFGYTGVSLYESIRLGMPGARSLAGQINGLDAQAFADLDTSKTYNWDLVANANLAAIVSALYVNASSENQAAIGQLEQQLYDRYAQDVDETVAADSVALGRTVAERIAAYAESDGQRDAYLPERNFPADFVPTEGEGLWVPTAPGFQSALQPYWGQTRPFLTNNVQDTLPVAPPTYSTATDSDFWIETMEVYDAVANLDDEQRTIAQFWSDDPGLTATPPGHSISIMAQILNDQDANLEQAAVAYGRVGMGLHDAFIACWYAKYHYNLVRPITVIREHIDPSFSTPVGTPPFPEYPSGHSVQSGAAAEILAGLFGERYSFVDTTHQDRSDIDGTPRNFASFSEFADEAAISRLYGGIHYRAAIELGVDQGRQIGANINALQLGR